jgi:hypothetical protein
MWCLAQIAWPFPSNVRFSLLVVRFMVLIIGSPKKLTSRKQLNVRNWKEVKLFARSKYKAYMSP